MKRTKNKLGQGWAKLKLSQQLQLKRKLQLGVAVEVKVRVQLLVLVGGWVVGWVGEKKTKLMLYSTLVEIEVEVGVELGNINGSPADSMP